MPASWPDLRAGKGCPLCAPRPAISEFSYFVCRLAVSSLYLARNQAYRGACTLVYDPAHVTRLSELELAAGREFCGDLWAAERAVVRTVKPDHVNIECLGNRIPHLHAGIIPRYVSDPRWGRPIWTSDRKDMAQVAMSDTDCERLAQVLRSHLAASA